MKKLRFALVMVFLFVTACTAAQQPADTPAQVGAPTGAAAPPSDEVLVESLEALILESFPVQVNLVVRGKLPDACSFIETVTQEREGLNFKVLLTVARRPDARCAPAFTPFEQSVALDVLGLQAGTYKIDVHGVQASFKLAQDNLLQPLDEPGG